MENLSPIEKKTLKFLKHTPQSLEELSKASELNKDTIMRGTAWLDQKKLAKIKEREKNEFILTKKGRDGLDEGLPEKKLILTLENLGGKTQFSKLKEKLDKGEVNIAIGVSKRSNWIKVEKGKNDLEISFTGKEKEILQNYYLEDALTKVSKIEKVNENELKELINRGLVEEKKSWIRTYEITVDGEKAKANLDEEIKDEINVLSSKILKEKKWKDYAFRKYNLSDPVPPLFAGKRQPYIQFLSHIRKKLIELGFKEMFSPLIVQEFYNFDILFQPQNHPARTWTDTYQLKNPTHGSLPHEKIVKAVKNAHESGGISASNGWQYAWSEVIASKLMPSAHATAHSARQIAHGIEVPGKYFSIARCYRPDVVDATHLSEFNQMDGFIVGRDLTFKHLLGMLKEFATEIAGATKVRFYPDYYPFTEPSVQLSAKHPELGWIEFGGAGMFRPEMMENLGILEPTIAWGLGIDRLAMFRLEVNDIRKLFSTDINWLRKTPLVKEI